jgi:hypothetical protein
MNGLKLSHEQKVLLWDCWAALEAADSLSMIVASRNHYKPGPVPSRIRKTLFDLSKKCRRCSRQLKQLLEVSAA